MVGIGGSVLKFQIAVQSLDQGSEQTIPKDGTKICTLLFWPAGLAAPLFPPYFPRRPRIPSL